MRNSDVILEAYKLGDAGERLTLYLSYPSLRRVFFLLEGSVEPVGGNVRAKKRNETARPKSFSLRPLLDLFF